MLTAKTVSDSQKSSSYHLDSTDHSSRSQTTLEGNHSKSFINVQKITEEDASGNDIEIMNNILAHMQKECQKRIELLKFVFDTNFERKIQTCIDTRDEMETRAAAFEQIIQSETLITKPVKEIPTVEQDNEDEFGVNFSQTGSTTDLRIASPTEPQPSISEHGAVTTATPSTGKTKDIISIKKTDKEEVSTECTENMSKKATKGFGEAALTKVSQWSKSALNFFRMKNPASAQEIATSERTSHGESSDYSDHTIVDIGGEPKETLKKTEKVNNYNNKYTRKPQKSKQGCRKGTKQKESKKVKSVLKIKIPKNFGISSHPLKKHAVKLSGARNLLKKHKKSGNIKKKQPKPKSKELRSRKIQIRSLVSGKKEKRIKHKKKLKEMNTKQRKKRTKQRNKKKTSNN